MLASDAKVMTDKAVAQIEAKRTAQKQRDVLDAKDNERRNKETGIELARQTFADIESAARCGRLFVWKPIALFVDEFGLDKAKAIADTASQFLREFGYGVEIFVEIDEPYGSDPAFDHIVYSVELKVTW